MGQKMFISPINGKKLMEKYLGIKYQSERVYYLLKESDYAIESIEIAKRRLEKEGKGAVRSR